MKGGHDSDSSPPPQTHTSDTGSASNTPKKNLISLQYEWVLWFDDGAIKGQSHLDYENSIKQIGSFSTIQDFWRYWNNVADPTKVADYANLRMFKKGIKPMWEDPANMEGGKWVIQCTTKEQTGKFTQTIALAIIGEQLDYGEDICGFVLSVRPKMDTINIWNRSGGDQKLISVTTEQLSNMIDKHPIRYQAHKESMNYTKSPKTPTSNPLRVSSDEAFTDPLAHNKRIPPTLDLETGTHNFPKQSPRHNNNNNKHATPSPLSKSGGYGSSKDLHNSHKSSLHNSYKDLHSSLGYTRERDSHNGRDRERDNHNGRDRDRDRGDNSRDRERDNHRDNHSRDRERDNHSRDRERDNHSRDRERDNHSRGGDRDNHRERDNYRERDRERDNHNGRDRDRGGDRDTHTNGRDNHRDSYNNRDRDRDNHYNRDRDSYNKDTYNNRDSYNNNHKESFSYKDALSKEEESNDNDTEFKGTLDFDTLQKLSKLDKSWADLEEDEDLMKEELRKSQQKMLPPPSPAPSPPQSSHSTLPFPPPTQPHAPPSSSLSSSALPPPSPSSHPITPPTLPRAAPSPSPHSSLPPPSPPSLHPLQVTYPPSHLRSHSPSHHLYLQTQKEQTSQMPPPSPTQSYPLHPSQSSSAQPSTSPSEVPPVSSMPHRSSGDLSSAANRLSRQEHKHHRKSRSVSVVEGQTELIHSILTSQRSADPVLVFDSPQSQSRPRRNSISQDLPFNLPPLPPLPTQHLLSIIEPPLPTIPELNSSLSSLSLSSENPRRHKKSASVSQIGSLQSLFNSPLPSPSPGIKIGYTHRSPSQEALNINIPPRKKSPYKDPSPPTSASFVSPSSASSSPSRRSSLPPPLVVSPPKRHSAGRIDSPYSPPSSSRGKTSSSSIGHRHTSSGGGGMGMMGEPLPLPLPLPSPLSSPPSAPGKRVIPYFQDEDDDEEEDVVPRQLPPPTPDPEAFRQIPARDKAFLDPRFGGGPNGASVSDESESPPPSSPKRNNVSEPPTTPSGSGRKRSRKGANRGNNKVVVQKVVTQNRWSFADYIGVIVLAVFVAMITVFLQHSW